MQSIINALFRKKNKNNSREKLNSATAKKVLQFIAYGLTYGAESLARHYRPGSKVSEFVAVCGAILGGLKPRQDTSELTDSVLISVHVNDIQKEIRFMQVGEHVILALDGCETIMSFTTLDQIYTCLRDDIMKHPDIYGRGLQLNAKLYPAS